MARIAGVSARQAGLLAKIVYVFTRRGLGQLAGRDLEHMLEPLEIYAQIPGLLLCYAALEWATAELGYVNKRLRCLAELKAATLTHCEYCIDLGSQAARLVGLSDEELLALPRYREGELFTDLEKLVLDYAVGMSLTPADVPEPLFAKMRQHFSETQLVELTHVIALENLRGRFNMALGIGAAGFSEGMVCAIPAAVTEAQQANRQGHLNETLNDGL
jgi:AhpD family alkylhydroperoxidase